MQPQQLDSLKERLLKAGVAPRHVHRYMRELRDHYEDALREELAKGLTHSTAKQIAWERLGNEENLTNSVLARPELLSVTARFPGLIFGAAPIFIWMGCFVLGTLAFLAVFGASPDPYQTSVFNFSYALCFFIVRILPVILGMTALVICARQRLNASWPILGTAIVALISGTLSLSITLPVAGHTGQIGVSTSLFPFFFPHVEALGKPNVGALTVGLARGACMLAISLTPYLLWRRHQRILRRI